MFQKNFGVKSQISEVFSDVSDVKWHLPPSGQLRGRVGFRVFVDSREGWEGNGKNGYVTLRAQLLHNFIANCSFFLFLGANGVGCLGRYCRDFGEWFWLFKPGLVEFYPSSPCCCLNLDSFDWKFGNWWWYLFFFYVLVVFWIFGWGLCKMIDLREKHNSSQNKRSMVKPGVINSCVVEFGGQVSESIRQLIMFLGVYCPKAPDPWKNG